MNPLAILALVGIGGYLVLKGGSSSGEGGGSTTNPASVEAQKMGYTVGYSDGVNGNSADPTVQDSSAAKSSGDPVAFAKGYALGYKDGAAKYVPTGGTDPEVTKFIEEACKRSTSATKLPKPSGSDTGVDALPEEYKQIAKDILSTTNLMYPSGEMGDALRKNFADTASRMADNFACSGYVDAAKEIYAHAADIAIGGGSLGPSGLSLSPLSRTVSTWRRGSRDFRL